MELTPELFPAFWRHVHFPDLDPFGTDGPQPFDWQHRLVEHIVAEGSWPGTLDIPTGLGKTTALDIAVFTLALSQDPASGLVLPRRTFMVIDRRVVVDQSYAHAQRLAARLREACPTSVVGRVADALRPHPLPRHDGRDPTARPLVAGRMRGGTTWAWRWLERPDQPAIIVGTIDQLGSRMLFDGYGVGAAIRPIDAALTGADSLVLVDEAHLAEAFLVTLNEARRLGRGIEDLGLPGLQPVILSATSGYAPQPIHGIDVDAEMADPVANARLTAPKTLTTVAAKVAKSRRVEQTGRTLANLARQLGTDHDVVGVVANTIGVARAAFDSLREGDADPARTVLITGRQRGVDRELLWRDWKPRIAAGRDRQDAGTCFVVATQTIEVGADLDFSAMVTESASIDAIVQRLGRLNRRGKWPESPIVVVHPSSADNDDPIYGSGRGATWEWLSSLDPPQDVTVRTRKVDLQDGLDVSPAAIGRLLADVAPDRRDAMLMPRPTVPVLFPWILDRWVQTHPRPLDAPATGPFLHGLQRDVPTVTMLWRHVPRAQPEGPYEATRQGLEASVELLPPAPGESIDLPIWAVEAWLDDEPSADVADVSTMTRPPELQRPSPQDLPLVAIDSEGHVQTMRRPLRPGVTLIVPTWFGGLDEYGWNPTSTIPVTDVADLVEHGVQHPSGRRRGRQTLRLDLATLGPFLPTDQAPPEEALRPTFAALTQMVEAGDDLAAPVASLLDELAALLAGVGGTGTLLRELVQDFRDDAADRRIDVPGSAIEGAELPLLLVHRPRPVERWSTDDTHAGTSMSGIPVALARHHDAVGVRARQFAVALGLPEHLCNAVEIAAANHDLGKLDPRFQQMLNGGAAPPSTPLAKSGMDPSKRWLFARSQQLAGYPSGMRHEIFSARALNAISDDTPERELVTHLVASHHGRARPLESAVIDPDPITYDIDTGTHVVAVSTDDPPDWSQPRRFRILNDRFGCWGLALLETIVRLSDIGCSSEGS